MGIPIGPSFSRRVCVLSRPIVLMRGIVLLVDYILPSFFSNMFLIKKKRRRIRVGMGVIAFRRGKNNSPFSAGNRSSWRIVLEERKWTVLTIFFQLSWGREQERVLLCNVHASYSAALHVLMNTDRSHEHRIHGLGSRLIWVPKAVLQINHKLLRCSIFFRFSFRNSVHIQQRITWNLTTATVYGLHRLRFLWKGFAFCTLPVWRMVSVICLAFYMFIQFHSKYPKLKQPFGMGRVSLEWWKWSLSYNVSQNLPKPSKTIGFPKKQYDHF